MTEIVVSLAEEPTLDITTVDIGRADDDGVLAFTVEGVIRGLDGDLIDRFVGESVTPTEVHFEIEDEDPA